MTSDSNYFETRKMYVLRIRVSITVRITKYFKHTPRTILETLWKRVCIIWKVLQFNKQLTSFNKSKRIVNIISKQRWKMLALLRCFQEAFDQVK